MKHITTFLTFIMISFFIFHCNTNTNQVESIKLETNQDSVSYIIGTDMARSLVPIKDEVNIYAMARGIQDKLNEDTLLVTDKDAREIMAAFSNKIMKRNEEKNRASNEKGEKKLEVGKQFLADNKNNDGVITTESGLQYIILEQGDGPKASINDNVTVHYRGTSIDGTEFDSSYKRGEPTSFPVGGVIKGWTEALQLMNVGSKYKLFIPSELAYGTRGAGGQIGPNEVLIFEVELIDISR